MVCIGQNTRLKETITKIDSLLYAHRGIIALPIIDSLLNTTIPEKEKLYLKANKVEALVHMEDYENALPFANKLLKKNKLQGKALMKTHIERALLYEVSGKMDESKKDLDFVANYYNNSNIKKDEFYGEYLYRVSSWHRITGNAAKSINYSERAIVFGNQNNFGNVEATGLLLLAATKFKKQINKKEAILQKALVIWKKSNNIMHINFMYGAIASCNVYKNKINNAQIYLDSAIVAAKKIKYYNSLSSSYRFKSSIYKKKKNHKKALEYYKKYELAKEKDILSKQKGEVLKIETKYNYQKKELENKILTDEITKEKKDKTSLIILSLIFFILLCILLFLIYRISEKRKIINNKSIQISKKNKELSKAFGENSLLLKELNHRVKNNLKLILSLIKFQYDGIDNEKYKNKFITLEHRIITIAAAHEKFLYSHDNINGRNYDIKKYLSKIAKALLDIYPRKTSLNLSTSNIILNMDTILPIGIIVNELISNSLKHAKCLSILILNIMISLDKNKIKLNYKDSGEVFKNAKNEFSLGVSIIESMVKQLKGKIERVNSAYFITLQTKNLI